MSGSAPPSRIYLDHNATAPLDPRVRDAVVRALGDGANPSSVHAEGRRARDLVEEARREVAGLVGASPFDVVFTSGGTEAVQLAIAGAGRVARVAGRTKIVASPLEHPCARGAIARLVEDGFTVEWVRVDGAGRIDVDDVRARVDARTGIAVFMAANHELGNVTDVAALAAVTHAAGARIVCDAVQAVGRVPVDVGALGVDLVALSAHKLGGPLGVGAVIVRGGALAPLGGDGHQERGRRPGTENVPGIVGFGVAASMARRVGEGERAAIAARRDALEGACLAIAGACVHGDRDARVPGTSLVAWDGAAGELVVAGLDLEGIAASTGAACSSGSVKPSEVLLALGMSAARAREGVRFSLGASTTDAEIARVAAVLPGIVARVRAAGPG